MKARTLLVFHSRTGYTRAIASKIAAACDCDVEELRDEVGRGGPIGWVRSAFEAVSRFDTPLQPTRLDPARYDLVIVGTPVWFWSLSSPVRTWLRRHHAALGKAAFFCTCGSSGDRRALAEFEALCGPAAASLAFTDGEIDRADPAAKVAGFVRQLGIGKTNRRSARKTARR